MHSTASVQILSWSLVVVVVAMGQWWCRRGLLLHCRYWVNWSWADSVLYVADKDLRGRNFLHQLLLILLLICSRSVRPMVVKCICSSQRNPDHSQKRSLTYVIATSRHMSNQHAYMLHLHVRTQWPYCNLRWSLLVFQSHKWKITVSIYVRNGGGKLMVPMCLCCFSVIYG